MSCSVDRVSYEQNGRGNDLPSKLLVFSRWFTVRRQHCIANYRTKTAKVIQTGARPKNALFTIKLSMKLSWSQASGLLATSYSISQSKKLYFSLGFRFSEISAVPFVLWSANQKNRFFPLSQSLYWRPPADQKASGLTLPYTKVQVLILNFLNRFYLLFGDHFGSFYSAEVRKVHVSYSAEFGDQTQMSSEKSELHLQHIRILPNKLDFCKNIE